MTDETRATGSAHRAAIATDMNRHLSGWETLQTILGRLTAA